MTSIRKLLEDGRSKLKVVNAERSLLEARLLLASVLKCSQEELLIHDDRDVSGELLNTYEGLIGRRLNYEPIATILGIKEFYGLPFKVEAGVLIPRPETEGLVEGVLEWIDRAALTTGRILDLGTGSGCIGIALARILGPQFQILGVDQSSRAIALAKENASRLKIQNIQFEIADFTEKEFSKDWTVIVSNPPYIPSEEIENLAPDVKNFDPEDALDGGPDGTQYLDFIFEKFPNALKNPGLLAVETAGEKQRKILEKRYLSKGNFWHDGPHLFVENE